MRYLLIIVFALSLYAQESCYSVQLKSVYKQDRAMDNLSKKEYDSSCKVMEIGKNIALRCGCFEKYADAKKTLPKFKAKYKHAYILSTYKSRFSLPKPKLKPISSLTPVASMQIVPDKNISKVIPISVKKKSVIAPPEVIVGLSNNQVIDLKSVAKKKKKQKKHHKKKHKKNHTKKQKVKRIKYVKKRETHYKYERYLKKLKRKKGLAPYDFKYKFGARLSYDFAYVYEADADYFKNHWRRIRVYHEGSFFHEKLFYELEYSFTSSSKYKNNFIGYQDKTPFIDAKYRVKVGNIKIPFSLEGYSSSKNITFMERSLNDAFAEGRKLGGELLLNKKIEKNHLNLFASIFSNSLDQRENNETNQPGYSWRTTYAYKFRKEHLLSLGIGYWSQNMKDQKVKFKESTESKFLNTKYTSVSVQKVDTLAEQNLELLYIYDKYSLQGEYSVASLHAINKSSKGKYTDYSFPAYYLQGSYFIRGEGKKYNFQTATLGKIKPNRDGAVELALRYSHVDLDDKDENNNGIQTDYNFGLNWYYNREIKFMMNYIIAQPQGTKLYDGRLSLLEGRLLFAF